MKNKITHTFLIILTFLTTASFHQFIIESDHAESDYVESIEIFSEKGGRVDWNSSTDKILIDQENEGHWDIYICNPDKSDMENLTSEMTGQTFGDQKIESWQHRGQPAFHPTGEYILFQVMNEHASSKPKTKELLSLGVNNDLWFMKSDGSLKQKLTNNPAGYSVLHPHFSHSGDKIMWAEKYADDRKASTFGAWRIKVADITIDSSGTASLSNIKDIQPSGAKFYESHGFSHDDSKIYFSGNLTTDLRANDIYEYNLKTEQLNNLTKEPSKWHEMYNINPVNHSTYSFISSEFFDWKNKWGWATLRTELYIYENGKKKQLTFYNESNKDSRRLSKIHYFIGDHCWSPDGKSILAVLAEASFGNTNSKIIKVNLK